MTDAQSNKLDMFLVVQGFYESNQAVLDAVAARATAFAQLGTNITAINTEIAGQSTNPTGVAQDKTALRNTLDNITATTLASAKAWALANGNNTLAAEFDYPISEIQRIKDDTVQGFCDLRIGLVNDNLAAMVDYGIDAATITAWQTALDNYVAVLESPREAINTRHLHTVNLETLFGQTSALFTQQLDPLMLVFKTTDPQIYLGYQQARIIINRTGGGTTPTSPNTIIIKGNVSDATLGTAIEGATVTLIVPASGTTDPATTDADGNYTIEITDVPDDGTYSGSLEASAPDYELSSQPIDISAGNTYEIDFILTPVILP